MTFILPGGNQLAPIIIFRLDELTQDSLLVKGFNQPLASTPLIQNQVQKQIKLIQAGKANDTGLYAGDDANANQVEVLDINTIPHGKATTPHSPPIQPPESSLGAAEGADATINQSSLTDASIPSPPVHIITSPSFALDGNVFFGGQTFSGFVARNIFVNTLAGPITTDERTPIGEPSPLIVDLSPYTSEASFDLVSVNDFYVEGSVTFKGLSTLANFALIAGDQFFLTPGITMRADVHNFRISSPATLTLDGVSLYNFVNNITLNSGADVSFQNGSLVSAHGAFTVDAGDNISSIGSQFNAGSAVFTTLTGSISFDATTLNASSHAIFIAPLAINLNNSTINADFVALNGSGLATISVKDSTINAPSSLNIAAAKALDITGSALNADAGSGSVNLGSSFASTTIAGTSITAHYLTVNSGDGILLDGNGQTFTATGNGSKATFTAPNLISLNNADFSAFAMINLVANTVTLINVNLPLITNVGTLTGNVNVNGPMEFGWFNLINSRWLGQDITSANQVTLSSAPVNAPGIHSYPR